MKRVTDTIKELKELDLLSYPSSKAQNLIRRLDKRDFFVFTLHPGKLITRGRKGCGFTQRSELSYCDQKYNTEYKRASTPNRTMFYGAITKEGESYVNRELIALGECLVRGEAIAEEEKITFGTWMVIKDIDLVVILDEDVYVKSSANPLLTELKDAYKHFISRISRIDPELVKKSKAISNFFATEFAKEKIQGDYDYLLSALFTEFVTNNKHCNGVMYPSVQTKGELGMNVAIKPDIVDNNMILREVSEATMYKDKDGKYQIKDDKVSGLLTWEYVDMPQHR